jgi:autotransporter translocation and assembly factor TamB
LLGLVIVFAVLLVVIAVLSQTRMARDFLREQTVSYLNNSYRGSFSLGGVDGSILWGITLHDLVVRSQNAEMLRVSRISVGYSIAELLRATKFSRIEIDRAVGHLAPEPNQELNLMAAMAPKHPQPQLKTPSKTRLTIQNLVIRDSKIELIQAGKSYRIEPVFIGVYLNLDGPAIDARVRRIAVRAAAPGIPNMAANGSLAYRTGGPAPVLDIPALTLSTMASQISVFGTINDLSTLDSHATLSIDRLAAADIERYVPQWSPQQNIWGTVRVRGPKKELHGDVDLFAASGRITAQAIANIAGQIPRFDGMLNISGFDVGKAIQGDAIQGIVDARVTSHGVGTSIGGMEGDATLSVRDAKTAAIQTRLITIQAGLTRSVATVNGGLTGGAGNADWRGRFDLGQARSYNLTLFLNHLNVRRVSAARQPIDSNLNLRAQVDGRGFDLATANARANIALLPSTVGQTRIASGHIGATIANQRVRSDVLVIATAAELQADGDVSLAAERRAQFKYKLEVADLAPWLDLVGQHGGGSLNVDGWANGRLDSLLTQDQLRFTALSYGTNYGCGNASIDMHEVGQPRMHGNVALSMNQIQSGVRLRAATLTASLEQLRPVTIVAMSLRTEDERSLKDRFDIRVRKEPARTEAVLKRIVIQDPSETWNNPAPARVVADANGLRIDKFLITSGPSRILLDGHAGTAGAQDVLVQIDRLRLGTIKTMLRQNADLSGNLSMKTHVGGTAVAPIIHSASHITGLRAAGQSYQDLSLMLAYTANRANLDLMLRQDNTHSLVAKGALPVVLGWANGFKMTPRGDIDFRASSSGLSLAFLNALGANTVREVKGILLLNLVVRGPVKQPIPTGFVKIQNTAATVIPTGVSIDDLELVTDFTPEAMRLTQMRLTSGKGTIDAHGQVTVENYKPGNLKAAIHLADWPAIKNQQYRATANGQINIAGTVSAPAVTGSIEIVNALLRPDIAFLTSGPPPPDPTIHLVSNVSAPKQKPVAAKSSCPPPPNVAPPKPAPTKQAEKNVNAQQALTIDMRVRLRRDIWVEQENGSAELTGEVQVKKDGVGPVRLIGEVDTVRGSLAVMGKEFKVAKAKVTFAGGVPIDPGLDITADYKAQQYLVHVIIGGTASQPTLTFKSEPDLEQADILSVLLFGKPTSQLGGNERADLKTRAAEVATGFAVSQVSQQVSQALGLEEMGIELRQTGSGVGVGSYLGQNTYASFSQDFSQQGGQRVDLQHYLTRHLEVDTNTTARGDRGADIIWSTSY